MQIIQGRATSIGALPVRRVLPYRERRSVGPFVFLDEMGPIDFAPGEGIDVPPHPHIGLSTLTYMLEGGLDHRDSLGVFQPVRPGAVNWMTAGHGVTHSERTDPLERAAGHRVRGIQVWVALPPDKAGVEPSFEHHPGGSIPVQHSPGGSLKLIAGEAFGMRSPVQVHSPLFYADVRWAEAQAESQAESQAEATNGSAGLEVALPPALGERAVYPLGGEVRVNGEVIELGSLAVIGDSAAATVTAEPGARTLVLGGEALPRDPLIHWNYVAWTKADIEAAKERWANGGFPATVDESSAAGGAS